MPFAIIRSYLLIRQSSADLKRRTSAVDLLSKLLVERQQYPSFGSVPTRGRPPATTGRSQCAPKYWYWWLSFVLAERLFRASVCWLERLQVLLQLTSRPSGCYDSTRPNFASSVNRRFAPVRFLKEEVRGSREEGSLASNLGVQNLLRAVFPCLTLSVLEGRRFFRRKRLRSQFLNHTHSIKFSPFKWSSIYAIQCHQFNS